MDLVFRYLLGLIKIIRPKLCNDTLLYDDRVSIGPPEIIVIIGSLVVRRFIYFFFNFFFYSPFVLRNY